MQKDVGINEQLIIEFSRICVEKNADLPAPNRFSDDALTEKLLMAVMMPPALAQTDAQVAGGNEAGAAAITEDEIDAFDIFGEPIYRPANEEQARATNTTTNYGPKGWMPTDRRTVAKVTGVAIAGIMLAMVMARRCLPSPLRLATILVVAGAQTGHAPTRRSIYPVPLAAQTS